MYPARSPRESWVSISPEDANVARSLVKPSPRWDCAYLNLAILSLRIDATADASFAAMRALSRLGVAMAAMMRTGIIAIPMYPMISPARAIPSPWRRPWLFRISERDTCPRMIATIAEGMRKEKKPRIKLAIALPLVEVGTLCAIVFADDISAVPHLSQK